MSSRDIEGENLLYLPQAKTYRRSCALGPWIVLGVSEAAVRNWAINIDIRRDGNSCFSGETAVGQIKRGFEELAGFLFRCQNFPHGAVLLTGTGIASATMFSGPASNGQHSDSAKRIQQPIPANNQVRSAIQKLAVKLAGMDAVVSRGSWISRLLRTS
jgi:hypothetical protein